MGTISIQKKQKNKKHAVRFWMLDTPCESEKQGFY